MADKRTSTGRCPFTASKPICLKNTKTGKEFRDVLHKSNTTPVQCMENVCLGSFMAGQSLTRPGDAPRCKEEVWEQAREFFKEYYTHLGSVDSPAHQSRLENIRQQIDDQGVYDLTIEEIGYGAKLAWRKASRCVARILWNTLHVFDYRHVTTTREMFDAICRHIEWSTNGGNIRSAIVIFPHRKPGRADFRLWNSMYISYAGYKQPDGSVIGDPSTVAFTQKCQSLGWKGKGTRFDILPIVVSAPGQEPQFYDIPEKIIIEVPLTHPTESWFAELDLKWYGLPGVADMRLDVGGIEFTAAPFNGWYTGPEIATRDLCDPHRYNILESVAKKMGLNTEDESTLWKDRALVVINSAVLHSYRSLGVTIVDHHSVAESFLKFMDQEYKSRGGVNADWVWIVPPFGSNLVPTYHQDMINYTLKPSYEYQPKAWKPVEN